MHGSGSESYPRYENGKTFPANHLFSDSNLLQVHQKIATSLRKRLVLTFIPSKGNGKVSQKLKHSQAGGIAALANDDKYKYLEEKVLYSSDG